MRDGNPANKQNWKLVCSHCAAEFFNTEIIDLANGHYQQEHPNEKIAFSTVWCGKGPAPKHPERQQPRVRSRRR